eukprot:1199846-Amorphochlora_amoeboformis.AAC.2
MSIIGFEGLEWGVFLEIFGGGGLAVRVNYEAPSIYDHSMKSVCVVVGVISPYVTVPGRET